MPNSPSASKDDVDDDSDDEDHEDIMSQLNIYTVSSSSYSCNICEMEFENLALCTRHLLRAHTYCHPYECNYCCQTFKQEDLLINHISEDHQDSMNHQEIKFLICSMCKHFCSLEELLKLHGLRKHASIYKYVCKHCGKCFKSWKSKNQHEKDEMKNSDENTKKIKPKLKYVCEKCSVKSKSKSELIKHLRDVHNEDFYENVSFKIFGQN